MTELYSQRLKIAVVTPSTNTTLETDVHNHRPHGVTVHTARIAIENRAIGSAKAYQDHVAAMRAGIDAAVGRVVTCAPDHLIMGVALEAFWGGINGAETLQAELQSTAKVPVTIGSLAMDAALQQLGVTKIGVLTPHMPEGDVQVQQWFEEKGYQITQLIGLKCESPRKIAQVPVSEMRAAVESLNSDATEAIVQVGTNLQFAPVAQAAQLWLGKPVLALNPVMCWYALRHHGISSNNANTQALQ